MSPNSQGSRRADREAKKAALGTAKQMALFPFVNGSDIKPNYKSEEISWALEKGDIHERPWIYIGQRLLLPQAFQWKFLHVLHNSFHIVRDATMTMVNKLFIGRGPATTIKNICQACTLCAYNNPGQKSSLPPLIEPIQPGMTCPGEDWQIDFTKMPPCRGYTYLLVLIDTFTG